MSNVDNCQQLNSPSKSNCNSPQSNYELENVLNSINNNTIENVDLPKETANVNTPQKKKSELCSRPNLELNLEPSNVKGKEIQCLLCSYSSCSAEEIEQHINRQHFDLTSPSVMQSTRVAFSCPLCAKNFQSCKNLEVHVNDEHKDVISPVQNTENMNNAMDIHKCPVCDKFVSSCSEELNVHVESHFVDGYPSGTPDLLSDRLIANELSKKDQEILKLQQQQEFENLQAQYGMDNKGNFREQSIKNMQKAVYTGELSVSDYYVKQVELKMAETCGIDDESSCVKSIIPSIKMKSENSDNVARSYLCTNMDFYSASYGDRGWGCGYRNLQMLISSLWRNTTYTELLSKQLSSMFEMEKSIFANRMLSISKLQQLIEWAWNQGFDQEGRDQLGGKVYNTKKWIGATEIVTVLSSLRFRCTFVDVHRPKEKGGHKKMFEWILKYFETAEDFKPPLYLQHDGHSQTVVGVEELKDGEIFLLVVDPSTERYQMERLQMNTKNLLKFLRKSLQNMRADQYQIATVTGVVSSEKEYQANKVIRTTKIF